MGRTCKIVIRHSYTTGTWVLLVNGDIKAKHNEKLTESKFFVSFTLYGHLFDIEAQRSKSLSFNYVLKMEGFLVKEIRDKADISLDEPTPNHVSITDVKNCKTNGKEIMMYVICCDVGSGEKVCVDRRYSDFVLLDEIVRGNTGRNLRSTLPKLPGKVLNPFFDQTSPDFVQRRKEALQTYLQQLLTNSKVCAAAHGAALLFSLKPAPIDLRCHYTRRCTAFWVWIRSHAHRWTPPPRSEVFADGNRDTVSNCYVRRCAVRIESNHPADAS